MADIIRCTIAKQEKIPRPYFTTKMYWNPILIDLINGISTVQFNSISKCLGFISTYLFVVKKNERMNLTGLRSCSRVWQHVRVVAGERTIYLGMGAVRSQAHLSQVGGWGSVRSSPV